MTYIPDLTAARAAQSKLHWSHKPRDERTIERFAQAISETGSTNEASKAIGITKDYGRALLARIRTHLGEQAR